MTKSLTDELQTLLTASVDAETGYVEAIKDSKKPDDLTGLFERMAALHEANAKELSATLTELGVVPDTKASIMSVIHKTIMDVRSVVGGLDKSVLPGLIDGETRNEKLFHSAIVAAAEKPSIQGMLESQVGKIVYAMVQMREMSESGDTSSSQRSS